MISGKNEAATRGTYVPTAPPRLLVARVEVLHNTHPERIRLSGIDCPERGQAFGARAKQALSALVFGRDVILQTHGQDKYGCALADVFLWDGTHVNHESRQGRLVLVVSGVCTSGHRV